MADQAEQKTADQGGQPPLPPDSMILLPVRQTVLFPGIVLPLSIGRKSSIAAAQEAVRSQRMLGVISGQEVRWALAERVHRQTEGNPLFVQEVLRYLVEEGLIVRKDGRHRIRLIARLPHALTRGQAPQVACPLF